MELAREGASVALVGRREDRLTDLAAEITNTGGNNLVVPADITDAQTAAVAKAWRLFTVYGERSVAYEGSLETAVPLRYVKRWSYQPRTEEFPGRAQLRLSPSARCVRQRRMGQGIGGTVCGPGVARCGGGLFAGRGRFLRRRLVLVVAAVGGAVLVPAAPAQAVIGVGNATFDNRCVTGSGAQARGATTHGGGGLGGNAAQAPVELSRQHCGNSGLTCIVAGLEEAYEAAAAGA